MENESNTEYRCKPASYLSREGDSDTIVDWSDCDAVILRDTVTGAATKERTEVKACWSPEWVYVSFLCQDRHVVSDYTKRDEPLYEQDVVEVFIDEDGDGTRYMEYEISPHNVIFDAKVENSGANSVANLDLEWNCEDLRTRVVWEADDLLRYVISFPATAFKDGLKPGTRWKVNFYRIDEDAEGNREYQAWRPTGAVNFHTPSSFGTFELTT